MHTNSKNWRYNLNCKTTLTSYTNCKFKRFLTACQASQNFMKDSLKATRPMVMDSRRQRQRGTSAKERGASDRVRALEIGTYYPRGNDMGDAPECQSPEFLLGALIQSYSQELRTRTTPQLRWIKFFTTHILETQYFMMPGRIFSQFPGLYNTACVCHMQGSWEPNTSGNSFLQFLNTGSLCFQDCVGLS